MFEGATHHIGVLQQAHQQPWSLLNSPSSSNIVMSKGINNMITSCVDLRGSTECVDHINISIHNNTSIIDTEDFFIGDLSDFSNEDIAAPIKNASLQLMDGHSSFQLSSDDNPSASHSKPPPSSAINSDSTTTAHTSPSGSVLLHASPTALDNFDSSLHIEMDSSLSLPCQNEAGFEWLTSFGEDNLIYDGASNFGMDSFLLSNAEPFDGGYDGLIKHGGYEDDSSMKGVKVGLTMNDATTNDVQGRCNGNHFRWHNENVDVKEFDAIMFMPYSTGSRSARTKRARSFAGWSSSNILCNSWDNDSPTTSLNSTSQVMPNPPYSSPTLILPKQEETKGEQHGYIPTQAQNVEVIASTLNPSNRDKPFNKATKLSSSDQPPNGWAKEVENTREDCVSNYSGVQPRRCTHCLSQKTPQWRAGPHGPKTLCNACGVRFKSGRLFDEYRPAKSPTFLSYKHSNSHKKVMEMRRRKTFQYNNHHHHHHHHQQAAHQARAAPRSFKHAEADPHLGNKLKIKLNPLALETHSHFSDVTLISTRSAIESPSSFLY